MISFNLICENGHEFEGWFKDSATFEKQKDNNLITCSYCHSNKVEKGLSAPNISTGRDKDKSQQELQRKFFAQAKQELIKARKEIEKNYDDVGSGFAEEARKMHYGEAKKRKIYGNATQEEVKDLNDEGVDVAVIPWVEDAAN